MTKHRWWVWAPPLFAAALATAGCKSESRGASADRVEDPAPVAEPANAEEATAATPATEPPADKEEAEGAAPTPTSTWYPGYWRWDIQRRSYEWETGFWQDRNVVPTKEPPPLRREVVGRAPGAGYIYAPGFWRWSGHEYTWRGGHWTHWEGAAKYQGPRWVKTNGRWAWHDTGYQRRVDVRTKWARERASRRDVDHRQVEHREGVEHREAEHRQEEHREAEHRQEEHREAEHRQAEKREEHKEHAQEANREKEERNRREREDREKKEQHR